MTKGELSKYFYLSIEIKNLQNRIEEIETTTVGSSKITGMPKGNGISNPVEKNVELVISLKAKLEKRKQKAMEQLEKIEEYIDGIQDSETRLIFTKRYVEFKRWEVIQREMCMSESSMFRRHSKQLRSVEK